MDRHDEERTEVRLLREILEQVREIRKAVVPATITDFTLTQIEGDMEMAINGTVVGTTSTFQIGFVPATNFIPLPTPPTVAVDDTNVTLGPVAADFTFTAAVAAGDTGTSYNLTISGTNDKGVALTHVFNVPILPTPPPPPTSVTDFSLNQVS
jgi:hypothetical protein